jgi:catechol 2,3-dioxygenase-like lactoylglutathione lyase family enzyme
MILGSHTIIYAQDPVAARNFFRDVLEFPHVDAHDGWLIFKLPPGELGIHPVGDPDDPSTATTTSHHELYLMCDDIEATVIGLMDKGVEFTGPMQTAGFGRLIFMIVPGAGEVGLYEPRHATAYDLDG